jgi:hypothetical protein
LLLGRRVVERLLRVRELGDCFGEPGDGERMTVSRDRPIGMEHRSDVVA